MEQRFHLEAVTHSRDATKPETKTLCGKFMAAYSVVVVIAPHDETCSSCLAALANIRKRESQEKKSYFSAMVVGVMSGRMVT
jgi:3-dehydroquinate dehydratase